MSAYTELHARLTTRPDHPRFTGAPVDIADLDPVALGKLWPLLQAARWESGADPVRGRLATGILDQAAKRQLAPRLDGALLLATLGAIPQERAPVGWLLTQVRHLATGPDPALAAALEPLLPPEEEWFTCRHALLAIGRAVGAQSLLARLSAVIGRRCGEGLPARECAVFADIALPALLELAGSRYYDPGMLASAEDADPAAVLAAEPVYVAFARTALEEAANLLERLHAGALPYAADGAFDHDEAKVLGMAARVAATRDEPWYPALIARLLPGACVAPTAARTAPSQALTIALGHAVEAVPTPEAVLALREALKVVRHAGLQKKLARHQKPAERALVRRPEVALRLLDADLEPKQQRALLAQFFESSFVRPVALPYGAWRARLLANAVAAGFARSLVWQAGTSFMLDADDAPVDAAGRPLAIGEATPVALWHPVDADEEEREAWRARIVAQRLRQPLRQVFREFYLPPDGDLFAGYELAAVRLIGLARREGWTLDYYGMTRRFGDYRVHFELSDDVYPGYEGVVTSRGMRYLRGDGAVAQAEVPARIVSEACRAVDLLVSVSSVALEAEEASAGRGKRLLLLAQQGGMDAMRLRVLAQLLHAQVAAGSVRVEGFHLHVGDYQVSIRTGRVLRQGTPVELGLAAPARRLRAVPWLPYDEALLERVLQNVGALLDGEQAA